MKLKELHSRLLLCLSKFDRSVVVNLKPISNFFGVYTTCFFESIHVFGFRYFIRRQIRPQHFRTKIQTFRTLCSLQAIYVSRCVSSYDESNQCASKGRGFLISRPIRMQDNSLTVNRLAKSGQERIELLQDYIST